MNEEEVENFGQKIEYVSVCKDLSRFERFKKNPLPKYKYPFNYKKYCREVKDIMHKIARMNGYALNPIMLRRVFYQALQKIDKGNMNTQQARNMAEVFSCLCNEYCLWSKKFYVGRTFFVTQDKWKRYMIGRKAKENSVSMLKRMGLIDYYNYCLQGNPKRRVRMYILNLEMMYHLLQRAEELHETDKLTDDIPLTKQEVMELLEKDIRDRE